MAVLVRGRADVEEERVRFIADDVSPFEGLRERRAEAASLRLTATGLEEETLVRLESILSAHRGSVPLYVDLALPHRMAVQIRLDRDWQVRPTPAFTEAVRGLLGPDAVVYRAGPRRAGRGRGRPHAPMAARARRGRRSRPLGLSDPFSEPPRGARCRGPPVSGRIHRFSKERPSRHGT
jgi:hypothetical protein